MCQENYTFLVHYNVVLLIVKNFEWLPCSSAYLRNISLHLCSLSYFWQVAVESYSNIFKSLQPMCVCYIVLYCHIPVEIQSKCHITFNITIMLSNEHKYNFT